MMKSIHGEANSFLLLGGSGIAVGGGYLPPLKGEASTHDVASVTMPSGLSVTAIEVLLKRKGEKADAPANKKIPAT